MGVALSSGLLALLVADGVKSPAKTLTEEGCTSVFHMICVCESMGA